MPADNLAIQKCFLAAFAAGDMVTVASLLHADFSITEPPSLPYAGVYHGPDGFADFAGRFVGMLDIAALEGTGTYVSDSGSIVGEIVIQATHKETGAKIDTTILEKWDFADGKVIRITPHYFDPAFR